MTVDRRTVLRSTARLATLTASGGLLAACASALGPESSDPTSANRPQPTQLATGEGTDPEQPEPVGSPGGTAPANPGSSPAGGPSASPTTASAAPPLAASTPAEVVNGPRDRPAVALTFHGQGDPAMATAVLEAAERQGARLTVMVVGNWLDQQPQMAQRILAGGHELGNHTQNHRDISSMTPAQAHQEIAECADRLQRLTGSIGRWFRPSAAQFANAMVREQARLVGYQHCLSFDVDPHDYADPGAEAVKNRVLGAVSGGSIVALHMGHRGTVEALPAILEGLTARGLHAVTASQLCS